MTEKSHLVRQNRTLCGLTNWRAGNVDIEFGVRQQTTCVGCLRAIACECLDQLAAMLPSAPTIPPAAPMVYREAEPQGGVDATELDSLRDSLRNVTANADFLRRSVGACHMMISRNDRAELDGQWEATDLPPRLKIYLTKLEEKSYQRGQQDCDARWEKAQRDFWNGDCTVCRSDDEYIAELRSRLALAQKTREERVAEILRASLNTENDVAYYTPVATQIVAELKDQSGSKRAKGE